MISSSDEPCDLRPAALDVGGGSGAPLFTASQAAYNALESESVETGFQRGDAEGWLYTAGIIDLYWRRIHTWRSPSVGLKRGCCFPSTTPASLPTGATLPVSGWV
ncbi:MAG: hypothetical protein AAF653_10275 [Chloroflexota bacterium]